MSLCCVYSHVRNLYPKSSFCSCPYTVLVKCSVRFYSIFDEIGQNVDGKMYFYHRSHCSTTTTESNGSLLSSLAPAKGYAQNNCAERFSALNTGSGFRAEKRSAQFFCNSSLQYFQYNSWVENKRTLTCNEKRRLKIYSARKQTPSGAWLEKKSFDATKSPAPFSKLDKIPRFTGSDVTMARIIQTSEPERVWANQKPEARAWLPV